jgi:hypothetical protein
MLGVGDTQIHFGDYFIVMATRIARRSRIIESCQLCCEEILKIENPNMSRRPPRPAWMSAIVTNKIKRFCLKVLIYLLPG